MRVLSASECLIPAGGLEGTISNPEKITLPNDISNRPGSQSGSLSCADMNALFTVASITVGFFPYGKVLTVGVGAAGIAYGYTC